ncbi:DUF2125 domain-containing protein [Roseovarius sp. 2305UL8-3]|uniref:DUF2125 domain-containing protein n=1 Tax=Roseovarius conchicola TaxID=3121636 RepID=UPI00352953D5
MRLLLTVMLVAVAGWSGYWFLGSTGVKSGFEIWFDERRADGWVAEYSDLSVAGYPNRIDTSFTDLALADPATGLAWEAPFFQILALSYRPNHVIAVWPNAQRIASPYEKLDVNSSDMRASLVLEASTLLTLARTTLTAEDLVITPVGESEATRIAALTLAAERVPVDGDASYRLGLSADGFAPSLPWRAHLDPGGTLPETLDALTADITVTFDKPWDRLAIEQARPQPRQIKVKLAEARWGQLELQVAGDLNVDANGMPDGSLTIKARNWRDILALAVKAGALPEGLAGTLEDGLGLIAGLAGNPKTLDIPLDFRNGRVLLGPVPIGPAPVLKLR